MSLYTPEMQTIELFFRPFDGLFTRSEPREQMRDYVRGLLSDARRKNTWQIAEKVGHFTPDRLQRLLYRSPWDANQMCQLLRDSITGHLGNVPGVGVIDESGFVKKGTKSAGVARQYCGRIGKVENCQVGVFLGYVTSEGHALLDRELYLPRSWCEDEERCREAHIPPDIRFQTKPQLAQQMLKRAWDEGRPLLWIAADTLYGNSPVFRNFIHQENRHYVVGISRKTPLIDLQSGEKRSAEDIIKSLAQSRWIPCATRAGEKGMIWYEWARECVIAPNDEVGEQWVMARRKKDDPQTWDYFLSNAPENATMETLVMVASSRHHIEEALEECKGQVGMADYEVRFWHSWYRHITLSMMAHTLLTLLRLNSPTQVPEKKNALHQLDDF